MKILFMGTPDFAVPSLKALVEAGHTVCGVFTQPDKPKNRGMKLQASPVKEFAVANGIPVFQPTKLRDGTALAIIRDLNPALIVVAAYGRILPNEILDYPVKGCINVHSSLLPAYRGAAPINWAILNGDAESGVTIMHMAEELDSGDIILQKSVPIDREETAVELYNRLAEIGAGLLLRAVEQIDAGSAVRTVQNAEKVTFAPMLSRALSPMDWNRTAAELHNQVRGLIPWPMAVTELDGVRCKVWRSKVCEETTEQIAGSILQADKKGLKIACGGGSVLQLLEIQPDGKKRMDATAFLMGHPLQGNAT